MNKPDLVLFVGEALAGNSALQGNSRTIDGIILSKFDTVDDKVGAAISMTYSTDKPILFVGTGQRCQDLNIINADVVTEALLK
jgi:signal recognition particle receptor subunit alpha